MHEEIAYCEGQFMPASGARLSIQDRGVRFGDGVFETLRVAGGVPYQWEAHIARLSAGLQALRIAAPSVDLKKTARELLRHNRATEGTLRIMVTRGVGSRGYLPAQGAAPQVVMEWLPPQALPKGAFSLYISSHRRVPPVCLPVNCKTMQGLGSTLALIEAQEHGCSEALQLTPGGVIACAAAANIYWVKGRSIFTPSLDTGALAGTMRARLMEISPYPIHEVADVLEVLADADAVFVTNSRLGVWAVESIAPVHYRYEAHPIVGELQELIHSDFEKYSSTNQLFWNEK